MSGIFGSSQYLFGDTAFYPYEINSSCRFNQASSESLTITPSGDGNRRTFTFSAWVKRSTLLTTNSTANPIVTWQNASNNSDWDQLRFTSANFGGGSQHNEIQFMLDGASDGHLLTSGLSRDTSAWYHIMVAVDTTQGTDTNRIKLYVNGEQPSLGTATYPAQNFDCHVNKSGRKTQIGSNIYVSPDKYYDGYIAEVHFIDGTALTSSSFGETKEGVWIPKFYTGSYGTNGYYLKFNQTGTGTASASTIGADSSGNDNHFTSTNLASIDSNRTDSPTNNFATWNDSWAGAGTYGTHGTLVNGALELSSVGAVTNAFCSQTLPSSGKYYAEMRVSSLNSFSGGLMQSAPSIHRSVLFETDGTIDQDNSQVQSGLTSYTAGHTIGILADMDAGPVQFKRQNSNYGSEVTLTSTDDQGEYAFMCRANAYVELRTDTRDFAYSIPDGYSTLSTANYPEPTISPLDGVNPSDHFNTVLYSGTGSSNAITGVGFQPDMIWFKERSANTGGGNYWFQIDAVRGATKVLQSNTTGVEATGDSLSLDSDGFTLGSYSGGNANQSGETYAAWNWLGANGTASNSDGSITSTVSANTKAGFSIVSYTGTGSATTIGHGLGVAPKAIIVKNRSASGQSWVVYHEGTGATKYLFLNANNAVATFDMWNNTAPTSSVFSVSTYSGTNGSSNSMIAYCFTDVEGYCKVGRFTGNGGTDGTYIYTGFRPAWVLIKNTADAEWWSLFDNKRLGYNEVNSILSPNDSNAEYSAGGGGIDLLSNGFKLKSTSGNFNGDGDAHIFLAFAESPFKYANAR